MELKFNRYTILLIVLLTVALGLQPASLLSAAVPTNANAKADSIATSRDTALVETDSIKVVSDSVSASVDSLPAPKNSSGLTATVNYKCTDSLVFSMGNMAFLYGQSEVTYDDINLSAERIQLSLDSSLVHANGIPDTSAQEGSHKLIGAPVFKDKSGEYETKAISYNFKTAKGFITDVVTQQGDGYVTGGKTKKMPDSDIFLENGRYTTCDYHECPHFYIKLTKARVRPKKNIVTGPAYLVVADVPLPLAIPFGYFPFTKSYSSGVIMPTYGADMTRGLYLRNGGYYFAINDYMDLALKGDIYTKGTWGLSGATNYAVRYKYNGSMSFSYMKSVTGDKGMPDYSTSKEVRVMWRHSQDNRFNPNMTLSASVNYSTTGYERNNIAGYVTNNRTENTKQSSVNATYRVPNSVWSFSTSASITQRQRDSTLSVQFPNLDISMSRVYPFKRKVKVGADRWYEKIAMSYTGHLENSITCKQDEFFDKSLIKDWANYMTHSVPISTSFTLFRYINVSPSFNFSDRMETRKVNQYYDDSLLNPDGTLGRVANDTIYGLYNIYNYSTSVSLDTKLYGFWVPAPFFKNAKLVAVRHLFTPSVSFSYSPDFGSKRFGYYQSYQMPDAANPGQMKTVEYTPYNRVPGRGRSGSLTFRVVNNIEAKFRSDKDSTGYKKVSIIDNLNTSLSYNMAADSMRWSQTMPLNIIIKTGKMGSMNFSGTFDTYLYDVNPNGKGLHRVDKLRWMHGQFPRLMNTSYSYGFQLNNKKLASFFGRNKDGDTSSDLDRDIDGVEDNIDTVDEDLDPSFAKNMERRQKKGSGSGKSGYDDDGYLLWDIPWSLNINYSVGYAYNGKIDYKKKEYKRGIRQAATMSGSIQPTKNWNFSYNMTYDFDTHKVSYLNMNFSRDMHCWTLTGSINPMGRYANFHVCIAVKSSMLSDLKYEKSSVTRSNKIEWYDD